MMLFNMEELIQEVLNLFEEYKEIPSEKRNSEEDIETYHKWYDLSCRLFLKANLGDDEDYIRFRDVDNSGNGTCLEHNFNKIRGSFCILIDKVKGSSNYYTKDKDMNNKVFVVYGHDNEMKQTIARFLEGLKLEPILLDESANKGRTIIEKIQDNLKETSVGIVLYSPCDEAREKGSDVALKPRARQNVVFEHGLLIGQLGKDKVIAIKKDDVEVPNDISGILYLEYRMGDWKIDLGKELKEMGMSVDLNDIK